AVGRGAGGICAGGGRPTAELVHVGVDAGDERLAAPRIPSCESSLLIPGRRLLPFDLGGKADTVCAGEGVGLEPGDVDDGAVRVEWHERAQAPLGGVVR